MGMWKDFSRSYLARNPAAARTIGAAALAAAFFLALLCGLFSNAWSYEVDRICREEGSWQARVTLPLTGSALEEALTALEQFAAVDTVTPNAGLSGEGATVVELTFRHKAAAYETLDLIQTRLGLTDDQVEAHDTLLSRYLVTDPRDATPPLLLPFLLAVWGAAVLALVLLLRNAFEITMQARLHQLGLLASIGATPRQLRLCLLQEAAVLALLPLAAGTALGFGGCAAVIAAVNRAAADLPGRVPAVFRLSWPVVAVVLLTAALTVFLSAWLPARKLSRLSPLEALRGAACPAPGRRIKQRAHPLLAGCFGIRGELAGGALYARKKSLRIANVSLLLSFMGFTAMLCFFTLSDISTRQTYFERYQDAWDVIAVVSDTGPDSFSLTESLTTLPGVEDGVVYQKQEAHALLPAAAQSDPLQALGGLPALAGEDAVALGDGWLVDAPVVVLDDAAFLRYCRQAGVSPSVDGAVLLNRVWDSLHSHFRNRQYLPFVQPGTAALTLADADGTPLGELPLTGLADTPPNLREEYDSYTLALFCPQSLWTRWTREHPLPARNQTPEVCVRLLGQEGITLAQCQALQAEAAALLDDAGCTYTIENRLEERLVNDRMIRGMEQILGAFCLLLAAIGLANVFLNTLGFVGQRRREFARYLSIGMTPGELRSLFWIEAAVLALRPLVITLPLTALAVAFMLRASALDPALFLAEAPFAPVALFALLLVGSVALAYALGARRILTADLSQLLKDDTLP